MRINNIDYNTYFGTRIRIDKRGLNQLTHNIGDGIGISAGTSSMVPSSLLDSVLIPIKHAGNKADEFLSRKTIDYVEKKANDIAQRGQDQVLIIEGIQDLTRVAESSVVNSVASTAASAAGSSYAEAVASTMEQTVHNPLPISDAFVEGPMGVANSHDEPLSQLAHMFCQDVNGEVKSASVYSTVTSTIGGLFHNAASKLMNKKTFKELEDAFGPTIPS